MSLGYNHPALLSAMDSPQARSILANRWWEKSKHLKSKLQSDKKKDVETKFWIRPALGCYPGTEWPNLLQKVKPIKEKKHIPLYPMQTNLFPILPNLRWWWQPHRPVLIRFSFIHIFSPQPCPHVQLQHKMNKWMQVCSLRIGSTPVATVNNNIAKFSSRSEFWSPDISFYRSPSLLFRQVLSCSFWSDPHYDVRQLLQWERFQADAFQIYEQAQVFLVMMRVHI